MADRARRAVAAGRTWRHYRAPDGNVYEVMGPVV
jgi:hypothetical protein